MFTQEGVMCEMHFPPVATEFFTNQFKNTIGIEDSNGSVVTLNNVQQICYGCYIKPIGKEFIVFEIRVSGQSKYYMWDDTTIEQVFFCDHVMHGTRTLNKYIVESGFITMEKILYKGFPIVNVPIEYLTQALLKEEKLGAGLMLSINGVYYFSPWEKTVVLQHRYGRMCDARGAPYDVDIIKNGCAVYEWCDRFVFKHQIIRHPDSAANVLSMKKNVISVKEIIDSFLVPRVEKRKKLPLLKLKVDIVTNREQYIYVCNQGWRPFVARNDSGQSKNAAMMRSVVENEILDLDEIKANAFSKYGYFFSNNFYPMEEINRGVLLMVHLFFIEEENGQKRNMANFYFFDHCTNAPVDFFRVRKRENNALVEKIMWRKKNSEIENNTRWGVAEI